MEGIHLQNYKAVYHFTYFSNTPTGVTILKEYLNALRCAPLSFVPVVLVQNYEHLPLKQLLLSLLTFGSFYVIYKRVIIKVILWQEHPEVKRHRKCQQLQPKTKTLNDVGSFRKLGGLSFSYFFPSSCAFTPAFFHIVPLCLPL